MKELDIQNYFFLQSIHWKDFIEILFISLVVFFIWDTAKNKKIIHILRGLIFLIGLFAAANLFELGSIALILKYFIGLCIILILIMSQPEIRKFLEEIGSKSLFSYFFKKESPFSNQEEIEEIVAACMQMGKEKTGAILVFEEKSLVPEGERGTRLDAKISKNTLLTIFFDKTPLHDGAVIIGDGKIKYAGCFLPIAEGDTSLGTRHNASIAATTQYDCFCLVVSEERGYISYVRDGKIRQNLKEKELLQVLEERLGKKKERPKIPLQKILISVILGGCFWFLLTGITDPIISMRYPNIPIEIKENVLEKDVVYRFSSKDKTSILATGKRSVLESFDEKKLSAFVDIRKISGQGAVPVEISLREYYDKNGIILNSSEKVSLLVSEEIVEKQVPVTYSVKEAVSGKYIKSVEVSPSLVRLKGPKSKISIVDTVSISFSPSQVKKDMMVPIRIFDRNGEEMDLSLFQIDHKEVEASAVLYNTKRVPLKTYSSDLAEISLEPSDILIAAEDSVLEKTKEIFVAVSLSEEELTLETGALIKTIDLSKQIDPSIHLVGEKTISAEIRKKEGEKLDPKF